MEVLFEVSEEDFNIPSCLVQPGNGSCGKFHIVGQQLYGEVVPGIVHGNSPYGLGVLFGCCVSFEYHNLINEYFRVSLVRQVTLFHALINQVVLDSDYKEHLLCCPKSSEDACQSIHGRSQRCCRASPARALPPCYHPPFLTWKEREGYPNDSGCHW